MKERPKNWPKEFGALWERVIPVQEPEPALYFLIKDEEVVYVGKSVNTVERVRTHRRDAKHHPRREFSHAVALPLGILEIAFIQALEPALNYVHNDSRPRCYSYRLDAEYEEAQT